MSVAAGAPAFAPIALLAGRTGVWQRVGFPPRQYFLAVDGQVVARLRAGSTGLRLRTFVTSEAGGWEIAARSFWSRTTVVRRTGEEAAVAEFEPRLWAGLFPRGGTLQFANGTRYEARVSYWQAQYAMFDDAGRRLVTGRSRGVLGAAWSGLWVDVAPEAATLTELPVLAGFVLHQMIAAARRSS